MKHSFRRFAELVPADSLIVANGDDKNTLDALDGLSLVRFGMAETNDVYGTNFSEDYCRFDVVCGGKPYCHLELGVIGRHNAMNALATRARSAGSSPIPAEAVQRALHEFHGAGRRLDLRVGITAQTCMTTIPTTGGAACASERGAPDGLPARDLCVPAAYLFPDKGTVFRFCPRAFRGRPRSADRHLRRARVQHHRHQLQDLADQIPGSVTAPVFRS